MTVSQKYINKVLYNCEGKSKAWTREELPHDVAAMLDMSLDIIISLVYPDFSIITAN